VLLPQAATAVAVARVTAASVTADLNVERVSFI
jgi:hypothetical protein